MKIWIYVLVLVLGFQTFADAATFEEEGDRLRALLLEGRVGEVVNEIAEFEWSEKKTRGGFYFDTSVLQNIAEEATNEELAALEAILAPKTLSREDLRLALLSQVKHEKAWRIRGTTWASEVPEESMAQFQMLISEVDELLLHAQKLVPQSVSISTFLIDTGRTLGHGDAVLKERYDRAMENRKDNVAAAVAYAYSLSARWGGDPRAQFKFAKDLAEAAGPGSAMTFPLITTLRDHGELTENPKEYYADLIVQENFETYLKPLVEAFLTAGLYATYFAEYFQETGDMTSAKKYFDQAVAYDPTNAEVFYWAGKFYETVLKDRLQAIAYYDKSIELDPSEDNPYNRRGFLRRLQGDYEGAIADHLKEISINERSANGYYSLALAYRDNEDFKKGMEMIDVALRLKSDRSKYHRLRCYLAYKLRDYQTVIESCTVSKAMEPKECWSRDMLGRAYYQTRDARYNQERKELKKLRCEGW